MLPSLTDRPRPASTQGRATERSGVPDPRPAILLLPQDEDKVNTASALKEVVEAANKKPTSASQIRIKGAGLVEAAKTVAEMAGPISTAVAAVVALFA